jgi:hypothetical protein
LAHQTWSDVDTKAGYIIVDPDANEVTHYNSSLPSFIDLDLSNRAYYSDEEASLLCEGNYIRVKMGQATESEIRQIKETIIKDYHALGCIVEATPVSQSTQRTATISSGASLQKSISEWIHLHAGTLGVEESDLNTACEHVFTKLKGVNE